MTLKILHIEPDVYSSESKKLLESIASVDYCECNNQEEFDKLVTKNEYDVIFMKLGIYLGRKTLDSCNTLKYVVTPTTGHNHIDESETLKRGVKIISLRGETGLLKNVYATAEHTWGLLLSVIRFIPQSHNDVLLGNWRRGVWKGGELSGQTIGIIGYGRLGRMVAKYALSFDMNVIIYDTNENILIENNRIKMASTMEELLKLSYIISLHIPLNTENNKLFSKKIINKIRTGSVLINTSRGELVDEDALLKSLKSNHLSAAALDVLHDDVSWGEKVQNYNPLIEYAKSHNNLVITPHIGGYTSASIRKTRDFVSKKLLNILKQD
ncbi:MAG: hypothetical protein HOI39_05260 [Flavobacteriales bacterium]|jgi:D-3-phosphoglycerate dehydrogenase / 2-oxoglutarate reductase|nr:hypothetical protein [Flavobacteriales bacterium]